MTSTFKICDFALKIYKIIYKIIYNHRKHITYVTLISLVQITVVIWYLNFKKPEDSLGNIEKGITELSAGQKDIKEDIGAIHQQLVQMVKKDSTMDNQLQHYPATLPLAASDLSKVSSTYSERIDPITGEKRFHWGIDYQASKGTPVYSTAAGRVEKTGNSDDGYGNDVRINHGNGYESLYAHLNDIDVKLDQEVKRGDMIGTVGSSGRATGNHLHYEITYMEKHVNPNIFRTPLEPITDKQISYSENYQEFMEQLHFQEFLAQLK
jgi:murein DD-endopeptidase MepM/ murein hydrolase activator NlpD